MHDDVADDSDATLDRRALIKKIGVAGAVAWTAPVVMDSVFSPAAAESIEENPGGPGPVWRFRETWINVDANSSGSNFKTYTDGQQLDATGWIVTGPTVASVDAIVVPNFGSGSFSTSKAIELGGSPSVVTGVAGGIVRTISLPQAGNYTLSIEWANPSTTAVGTFSLGGATLPLNGSFPLSQARQTQTFAFNMGGPGNVTLAFNGSGSDNSGAIIGLIEIYI